MQTIKIADICRQSQMQALIMKANTPLEVAIQEFAGNHYVRGIFLVDDEERLVGVVNKQDILNWIRLEVSLPPQTASPSLVQMRRLLQAELIEDIALPDSDETAVSLDDTLADALNTMTRHNLVDIPVVDENGRIVNDLRLSEVLALVLDRSEALA